MNKITKSLIPFVLIFCQLLTGCVKKSECELPTRHVHRYTKPVTEDITLETYLDDERLTVNGYEWQSDYIEINKVDEELYKLLKKYSLINGPENWDYFYNLMASQEDYLEFYYEYTTVETYTTTDSEGNVTVKTRLVHHDGWHRNPYDSDNTGRTRLYHHRFYGYMVVYEDGKFRVEQSPAVDDIRQVIGEYPYFKENCITKVYEEFRFSRSELPYLSPEDFDVFTGPDLTNPNLETGIARTRENDK